MLIEDEHISAVLQGDETVLPEDVKDTIRSATGAHAKAILDQLRELQVDLRSNPAVFIGGGSILLRPFIEQSPAVVKVEFVTSPNANALGYQMLGQAKLSRRACRRITTTAVIAMKKDGKYRFSLQFGAETEEQQSVGELLERLGNRKSAVVVAAVSDYILAHPEAAIAK